MKAAAAKAATVPKINEAACWFAFVNAINIFSSSAQLIDHPCNK
jgi:hypothetical protein